LSAASPCWAACSAAGASGCSGESEADRAIGRGLVDEDLREVSLALKVQGDPPGKPARAPDDEVGEDRYGVPLGCENVRPRKPMASVEDDPIVIDANLEPEKQNRFKGDERRSNNCCEAKPRPGGDRACEERQPAKHYDRRPGAPKGHRFYIGGTLKPPSMWALLSSSSRAFYLCAFAEWAALCSVPIQSWDDPLSVSARWPITASCVRRQATAKPRGGSPIQRSVRLANPAAQRAVHTHSFDLRCFPPQISYRTRSTGLSTAPSGTMPASRNRQSAIKSFRARATIPILRSRLLPWPKRAWYHFDRALSG